MYLRQRCFNGSVNKTIVKPCIAAATNTYTSDFPDVKFHICAIVEKVIRFQHPDYNPDRAQKLISSSMSWHLSTCNISSKSMHAFLSNLANRQTDKHGQKHLPPPLSEVTTLLWLFSVKHILSLYWLGTVKAAVRVIAISSRFEDQQRRNVSLFCVCNYGDSRPAAVSRLLLRPSAIGSLSDI